MKTAKLVQSLGLGMMMTVSAAAFAHGDADSRFVPAGPAFCNHPAFQENLRLMKEINERQDRQHDRILNGYYEKRINPIEFRMLMGEQNEIRHLERAFLADGFLTRIEYQKLDGALDHASRSIFREGHDAQGYPGGSNHSYGYGNWSR